MTRLVIAGAGGLGREVHDVVEAVVTAGEDELEVLGFLDDGQPDLELLEDRGVPHLGPVRLLAELAEDVRYLLAIGSGPVRARIDAWATGQGRTPLTLVHPSAVLGRHRVSLGAGTIVCAGACITTNVRIGRHAIVDRHVNIGHDAVLGDYVTLHPNATLSGAVVLEDGVTLGTHACVIPGCRVGARSVIGAAAAVIRDVPCDVTAVGVPAVVR